MIANNITIKSTSIIKISIFLCLVENVPRNCAEEDEDEEEEQNLPEKQTQESSF